MKTLVALFASVLLLTADGSLLAQPDIRIHPSGTTYQIETSIAIHPANAGIVLAAAIAGHMSGSIASIGWYYTTDAGATWTGSDTLPTHTDFPTRFGDPAVAIDLQGSLFVNGIAGDSTYHVFLARSTDGGMSWDQADVPPESSHKNHLAIDVNPSSPYLDSIYIAYATRGGDDVIRFSRSADRGETFSTPVTINGVVGTPRANAPNLAVGPEGELFATWIGPGSPRPLGFNKSTDAGLSWGVPTSIRQISNTGAVKGIDFSGSLPSMAADRSSGPRRGWIYIVYPQRNPSTPDIFLVRSTDGGNSWSDPTRVNQDASGNDQWLPWICVDPATGNLFVVYYDSRNFPANDSAEVYISASADGGETFGDLLVSDAPFKPSTVPGFPFYGGAYIGIAALRDTVWPCWYDNRSGTYQIYTSCVLFQTTSVGDVSDEEPSSFWLAQNYPNPFNPRTEIRSQISEARHIKLAVYDLLGREVAVLVDGWRTAGTYRDTFSADRVGTKVLASGVYICRMSTGSTVFTRRMLLLR